MTELFSDVAEEKEISKITGKLKEARSVKSYYIFEILSRYVSESCLLDLIKPLKEVGYFLKFISFLNILLT